mgnify:CR=1 FL=1
MSQEPVSQYTVPTPSSLGSMVLERSQTRQDNIQQLLSALCQRHQLQYDTPPQKQDVEELLYADQEANRRWSGRVNGFTKLCGWLGKWLPFHDLELLGLLDFDSLSRVCNYTIGHFLLSSERPVIPNRYHKLLPKLESIRAQIPIRPEPYRQQPCTAETAIQRAILCLEELTPNKKMLFLGDDDLTSVAVALVAKEKGQEVDLTVVDLDTALLENIDKAVKTLGIPIQATVVDLFGPEKAFDTEFDVILADPSYEENWVRQFTEVAIDMLAMNGHYMLCLPHPFGKGWLKDWVEVIEEAKPLRLLECREAFNEYPMLSTRRKRMGPLFTWFLPVGKSLAEQYQALPFTYSDLFIFRKTEEKRPAGTSAPLPSLDTPR